VVLLHHHRCLLWALDRLHPHYRLGVHLLVDLRHHYLILVHVVDFWPIFVVELDSRKFLIRRREIVVLLPYLEANRVRLVRILRLVVEAVTLVVVWLELLQVRLRQGRARLAIVMTRMTRTIGR